MTCAESCCAGSREEQQERRKRPKNREPNPSLVVHRNLPPAKKLVVPVCIFRNHKLTNPDLSPGLRARRSDEREFAPNSAGFTQTYAVPPETLRTVAEETGGRFFEAPTEADLEAVYREIGSQVSYEDEQRELTAAFAGAGAVFLLLGAGLSALWFGRIP